MFTRCQTYAKHNNVSPQLIFIRKLCEGGVLVPILSVTTTRHKRLSNLLEDTQLSTGRNPGVSDTQAQASQLWLTGPNLWPLCSLFSNKDLQIFESYPSSTWQCAGLSPKPLLAEWRGICELAESRPCRRRLPTNNTGGPGLRSPSPSNAKSCASLHVSSSISLHSHSLTPCPYPWPIHIS